MNSIDGLLLTGAVASFAAGAAFSQTGFAEILSGLLGLNVMSAAIGWLLFAATAFAVIMYQEYDII